MTYTTQFEKRLQITALHYGYVTINIERNSFIYWFHAFIEFMAYVSSWGRRFFAMFVCRSLVDKLNHSWKRPTTYCPSPPSSTLCATFNHIMDFSRLLYVRKIWLFSPCVPVQLAPSNLSTMCQPVADNAGRRHLRSASRGDLAVPDTRTLRYGPHSFAVAGPSTLEFSPSTATQLPTYIRVPSWIVI